ncbi:MAG: peptidase C45 [Flavobacteriales bacterium]|nr:peptidase C45 [Flavobacteriales bacterium]
MAARRALRRLRNIALVASALLVIGAAWFAIEVHVSAPLSEGETDRVPARSQGPDGRWHVGRNWLGRDSLGLYEAYVEGGELERGLAYGALASELIEEQERIFVGRLREMVPGAVRLDYLKYFTAWYNRDLDEHVPHEYLREIYGVSRSFADAYDFVGPKYMRALNYHAAHDIGHALTDLAMVGCTSFAAKGERSADGQLIIGRNFDFWMGDDFAREKLILFIRPDEGIPHVLVSWGGFMGAASAMNLEGLTVTINAARSELPYGARTPIALLARAIVQHAATIDEAIAIAAKHEVFVSESILVASARDGRAVIIEKAPNGMDVYDPGTDLLVCANHYQSDRFKDSAPNQANIRESDSMARFRRMQQLVDSAGTLDPSNAAAILRERKGFNGAELGMGNPASINQLIAHHAVIMQPTERRLYVSAWPYQLGAFACYDLRDVFARCASGDGLTIIRDTARTIGPDPFLITPQFAEHQWWQQQRTRIASSVLAGAPITLTAQETQRFVAAAPDSYITHMALGDLHRARQENVLAAERYSAALRLPVASKKERERLEERLRACTLAAAEP